MFLLVIIWEKWHLLVERPIPFSGWFGRGNNGVGYGVYGVGAYSGATGGYSGPASAYGNPNVVNAEYASGLPGASRSLWGTYVVGYVSTGYNANVGYGGATSSSSGSQSAPITPSPSNIIGYGNQGYGGGYGAYSGSDGAYGNPGSYWDVGGHGGSILNTCSSGTGGEYQQGSGYMGSGYDGNSGYPNAGWMSDVSQGGNYGVWKTNWVPGVHVDYGGYCRHA